VCVQEDVDGEGGSGSDAQGCCDEAQLVTVKTEPPDTSSSESPDGDSREEPLTCVNIKQEVEVSQVQMNRYHVDKLHFEVENDFVLLI
jgi:hypothetical protein